MQKRHRRDAIACYTTVSRYTPAPAKIEGAFTLAPRACFAAGQQKNLAQRSCKWK
jgi:hypothetical protein